MAVLTGVICAINDWELINPYISLPSSQVQLQHIIIWSGIDCEGETNALQDFANLT